MRTFYDVDGHDVLLDKEMVNIKNKKERKLTIEDPTAGWVLVENKRKKAFDIVVDGVLYDRVEGKSKMWLSVEFGKNKIEIMDAKGRMVTSKSVEVRPYDLESIQILAKK